MNRKIALLLLPAILAAAAAPAQPVQLPASVAETAAKALALADTTEAQVIAWRRRIHQHPELAWEEKETAALVAGALATMPGWEVTTGIAGTGVKAVLRGGRPGPVVALRADMDALPVLERNDLPFRSTARAAWQGVQTPISHACGHDAHTAMLLGAAEVFSKMRSDLPGTVVLLFQPAEEAGPGPIPSGAKAMFAAGVLNEPKVDIVMGQHIGAGWPSGAIGYRRGSLMASGDRFDIKLTGKGGHGSSPWTARSPVIAAAEIVQALQSVVSNDMNPLSGPTVLTVGMLQSGNKANILPENAEIAGTIRSLSVANQKAAWAGLRSRVQHIAEAYKLESDVRIGTGYNVLVSDPAATESLIPSLLAAAGEKKAYEIDPSMASEDFGSFGAGGVPVVFWRLMASPFPDRAGAPNHSPEFAIDEKALRIGTRALVSAAWGYMSLKPKEGSGASAKTP
jgi:amidohydrolase